MGTPSELPQAPSSAKSPDKEYTWISHLISAKQRSVDYGQHLLVFDLLTLVSGLRDKGMTLIKGRVMASF